MYLEMVLFSIDKCHDIHTLAKFTRLMDTKRVTGELIGSVVPCIGGYNGQLEYSFLMTFRDYMRHVLKSGYVDGQESIMLVPGDTRQPCVLATIDGKYIDTLASMSEWSCLPLGDHGWTYVIETQRYMVC